MGRLLSKLRPVEQRAGGFEKCGFLCIHNFSSLYPIFSETEKSTSHKNEMQPLKRAIKV